MDGPAIFGRVLVALREDLDTFIALREVYVHLAILSVILSLGTPSLASTHIDAMLHRPGL
jgi:hypothetical protein